MDNADCGNTLLVRPNRPDYGTLGSRLRLKSNHFAITLKVSTLFHYHVSIVPGQCPRRINREIFEKMVQSSRIFTDVHPVYDGRTNMYIKNILPFQDCSNEMEFEVALPGIGTDRTFKVTLTYAGKIDLQHLKDALNPNNSEKMSLLSSAAYAVDVILRYLPSLKYTTIGRSFFTPPDRDGFDLSGGRELWYGHHQSVSPSQWKMLLNVDVSTGVFHKSQNVVNFLFEILNISDNDTQATKPLPDSKRLRFAKEIKGLKIEVTHRGTMKRKYRVCDVTRLSAELQTFPLRLENGGFITCTVADYFHRIYGMLLNYPHLPCLQVGKEEKPTYLPLEVCVIVPGQRCVRKLTDYQTAAMIEATSRTAPERQSDINKIIFKGDFDQNPFIREFSIQVSKSLTDVAGRVLPAPILQYGGDSVQDLTPSGGMWNMRDKQFYHGVMLNVWAIVCFCSASSCSKRAIGSFIEELRRVSREAGMLITQEPCFNEYVMECDAENLLRYLIKTFKDLQLIMVLLPGKTPVYAEIKRLGDTVFGIATQCVNMKNVNQPSTQTLSNLCLKINVKLGGINNILLPSIRTKVFNEPVIFFGAVVYHTAAGDNKAPTITAVVASMDAHPSRYAASIRIQKPRQKIILNLTEMVRELLLEFYRSTHFKPARIIMYRNGVSSNLYNKVLFNELLAIRKACLNLEIDYKPGITFVAVDTRHHTRFFCANRREQVGKSCNIPAGTTVDVNVTHTSEFDFYLCSHRGIEGTSRPAYYRVLWDDNRLSSDELQSLTYQLCYTYARCTRSVSVPAPVYYALLVAMRARYHLVDKKEDSDGSYHSANGEEKTDESLSKAITLHSKTRKTMYFA